MPDYLAAAYTMKIKPRMSASGTGYLEPSDFSGTGTDLIEFLHAFCLSVRDSPVNDQASAKFLQTLNVTGLGRGVYAEIEAGSSGLRSRLYDTKVREERYQRQVDDAELLPLRNIFIVPEHGTVALLMTERVGKNGLISILGPVMRRTFSSLYTEFVIEIEPLAPAAAIKHSIEDGKIKAIRLVKYGIPSDVADQYMLGQHEEQLGNMELYLRPGRNRFFGKSIADVIDDDDRKAGLLEFNGVTYDDIKLEVRVGNQNRTLTITREIPPRVTFPISPQAATDALGRPLDEAFYGHATDVARELSLDLGINFERVQSSNFKWTDAMLQKIIPIAAASES